MKRFLVVTVILLLLVGTAFADDPPYRSYSFTTDGRPYYMQCPYLPMAIVGQTLYGRDEAGDFTPVGQLKGPSDLFADAQGFLYVADRDNHRVVKMTTEGELLAEYGVGVLKSPEGVFVDSNGTVFVADTGNAQVALFNPDGTLRACLGAPDDVRLQNLMFTPVKIAVDGRGYIFVLLKGGNEGLMLLTQDGRFQGYFARNATQMSLLERAKRVFYTEAQIATNQNAVAPSVTGMCVSQNGYVYTCTSSLTDQQIKKYNASGNNLFANLNTQVTLSRHGDMRSSPTALFVDGDGVAYAIDGTNGAVVVYDANGKPLMMFGEKLTGNDVRIGFFSDPVAVTALGDGTLLVLDRAYNGIHMFRPTTLMKTILGCVSMYNDGRYIQAQAGWTDILKANANYYWAHLGLGKIAYMTHDYPTAMTRMRLAKNQEFYSDALWKYRAQVVYEYAGVALAVLLSAVVLLWLVKKTTGFSLIGALRGGVRRVCKALSGGVYHVLPPLEGYTARVRYALRILSHPIDTLYEVTRQDRGSLPAALSWYAVFLAVMIGERALTNFVFDLNGMRAVSLMSVALTYVVPVVLWIVGNYLVGTISKGQGTLRGIVISTVYALMPMIVLSLPIALISNALTLAEGGIYWIVRTLLYAWVALLLFIQVKEIHGYEFGETVKNILWILFVAAMAVVTVLAVCGVMVQAYNFLNEFFRELLGYV